ncbi:unnamed protein product [Cuscuta europaea]|uniref:Uncharacterized protein n=1 Tax=Cuscuta europaea TaxID=41803 RepID=A0A9P1A063_CUSEU|nr:unnamed protein product [Cuscuta europaea]
MEDLLGMQHSSLPLKYLGSYLHKGINRVTYYEDIIKKIDNKLSASKQKNLSQARRVILIKHVSNTIPIHFMVVDIFPKKVIRILGRKMAHFFGIKY